MNTVTLINGDLLRVVANKSKKKAVVRPFVLQAKEVDKKRGFYTIGAFDTMEEGIAEMNKRAEQYNSRLGAN
jgi:hypothetical protein